MFVYKPDHAVYSGALVILADCMYSKAAGQPDLLILCCKFLFFYPAPDPFCHLFCSIKITIGQADEKFLSSKPGHPILALSHIALQLL